MIDQVSFMDFKALHEVCLDLARFTVLVGPNASGKTSVLEGLHFLSTVTDEQSEATGKRMKAQLTPLVSRPATDGMILRWSGDRGELRVNWRDRDLVQLELPTAEGKTAILSFGREGPGKLILPEGQRSFQFPSYGPTVFLHLDPRRIAEASYSDEKVPRVGADGKDLAAVLAYMQMNRPDDYAAVQVALREVIPSVQRVRTPRTKIVRTESEVITVDDKQFTRQAEREYWGNSIEFDVDGASRIPAQLMSEGTLLVLALITVLMGPERPKLVLLDDIDRALHPKAQEDLVGLLRRLMDQNPELQIVATSHSPYLLDHLRPEEVRLTALKDDGSVAVGRLDEHPKFEKWKEEMTPGEFWSMVGEKWVAGAEAGEPGP